MSNHNRLGNPDMSPIVQTNIKAIPRDLNSQDKFSQSKGRTSQQLCQSMEDSRKRNLVNVSQHIMSPSQQKAISEQKGQN